MLKPNKRKSFGREVRRRATFDEEPGFKRTHTISGYDLSVASEKNEQVLKREKVKKDQTRKNKLTVVSVCLIATAIIVVVGLFQYSGSITNVNTTNQITGQIDKAKYISVVNEYFNKRPIERFSFMLNNKNFTNFLTEKISEIESASINNRSFLSGELSVRIREPVAVWQGSEGRQYIDGNGIVFDVNLMNEPQVTIEDNTLGVVSALPVKFLRFIGQVISGIERNGAEKVEKIVIPPTAIRYVEFHLTGRPYPFKAQIDRDINSQVGDILNIIKFLDINGITPGEYVDTRVESKAYWK